METVLLSKWVKVLKNCEPLWLIKMFHAIMCMCQNWDMRTQAQENIYKNDAAKKNNQSYSTLFQILVILLYIIQLN